VTAIAVEMAVKRCPRCAETKPLSQFHRNRSAADGHHSMCKMCTQAYTRAYQAAKAAKRAELGDEAWRAYKAAHVRAHRERTGGDRDREYARTQYRAVSALIDRHRAEYDRLLLLARRGELEVNQ